MFEQFSRGYYLGRLYVEPSAEEAATICQAQHEQLNRELYAAEEGVERLDWPLVMKVGTRHLPVHGSEAVPADTLAVPEPVAEDGDVGSLPDLKEVLLAKGERARQLLDLHRGPANH